MRILIVIILTIILSSCGEREARQPVSRSSGSYINQSIKRNKELIAQEENYIRNLIQNDTLRAYEASSQGFWYTYVKKNDSVSSPNPKVGDLVLFNYNLETLDGQKLVTQEELGNVVTQIDQSNQELITGIREGLKLMEEGEKVTFLFLSHKAYGYYGLDGKIPSNMPVKSTVTILEIKDQSKN